MTETVSILIPCHNAEPWLVATIESALSQTWPEVEVIVVDDGSTDKSFTLARRFEGRGVKVLSQECRGASHARNRAFELSSGSYIQYLDSDDLLAPNKIELQMNHFKAQGSEAKLLSCSWASFFDDVHNAKFRVTPVWRDVSAVEWLITSWEGGGMMHPASWLIRRELIESVGLWNESLSLNDDGEFFTRAILGAGEVFFCEKAQSFYRQGHSGRLSALRTPAAIHSAFQAATLCAEHLLSLENSSRTRHACASLFQRLAYTIYPEGPDYVQKAEARVAELGGTSLSIEGGAKFQLICRVFGWKRAKLLQRKWHHLFRSGL